MAGAGDGVCCCLVADPPVAVELTVLVPLVLFQLESGDAYIAGG